LKENQFQWVPIQRALIIQIETLLCVATSAGDLYVMNVPLGQKTESFAVMFVHKKTKDLLKKQLLIPNVLLCIGKFKK
jgi:hypothetical protein